MWISWYWVKLILECPDFVRPQRVGYLGSAHLNVCFWSHPGGSFGQSLGQVTAIFHFFTAIQSLMAQIFIFIFFSCSIWWWGFSGKRQQNLHLCICEHTTLPVGDSLDQQLLFAGCWSPCANTRCYAAHPGFNKNCAPNYKVVMVFAWLLHQNFMECPPLRWPQFPSVLSVFTTFPHFISSFCHSSCPRLAHACVIWVLQPTKRRLKWFSLKGMEVRPRPTAWKRPWLLLLCPNCWAGSSLPLVTTW